MEHKRELVLSVIFKEKSEYSAKMLEYEVASSGKESKKEKEIITLKECLNAFSREELLSGDDQWYCNKCKQQQDIHKKLELYRLPKILIVQLKRFQSKKSASKASGFIGMAYA